MENMNSTMDTTVQPAQQQRRNAETLSREINWFASIVNARLDEYFPHLKSPEYSAMSPEHPVNGKSVQSELIKTRTSKRLPEDIEPPDISGEQSVYADFVNYYNLNNDERLLLILALIPHVQPHLLDIFFSVNKRLGRGYTEFGGLKGQRHSGFLPTIETAFFILAGNDLDRRFKLQRLFETDHFFSAHNIISFDHANSNEPFFCSQIILTDEYVDFFTTGKYRKPQFSLEFPARHLTTQMEWSDLVVDEFTARQLDEMRIWLKHGGALANDWGMSRKCKPGFKALFHGPPGTGKTLAASLLGKLFNLDVYRIDLSMIVSKYIGETEKNLEKVFRKSENKNWILFFDEADALFGKRTNVSDAHDKYANQEVSYLLQRLEEYPGLIILASNMRNNVDEAFTRRLNAIIHFPKPQTRERLQIWSNAFSPQCVPPARAELETIAQQYELAGGSIMNVVQYASLQALNRNTNTIVAEDILQGIKKEFHKEGKTF